jgi:hypothetical protein
MLGLWNGNFHGNNWMLYINTLINYLLIWTQTESIVWNLRLIKGKPLNASLAVSDRVSGFMKMKLFQWSSAFTIPAIQYLFLQTEWFTNNLNPRSVTIFCSHFPSWCLTADEIFTRIWLIIVLWLQLPYYVVVNKHLRTFKH